MKKYIIFVAMLSFFGSASVLAEKKTRVLVHKPTVKELQDALMPRSKPQASTRSVKFNDNISKQPASVSEKPRVALGVHFKYNSAELTEDAKQVLDVVVESIKTTDLRYYSYQIEGYTDALGDEDYNLKLSRDRALSVKTYLASVGNVDPRTLKTKGFGEHGLVNKSNPYDPLNRRVEIVNIGP